VNASVSVAESVSQARPRLGVIHGRGRGRVGVAAVVRLVRRVVWLLVVRRLVAVVRLSGVVGRGRLLVAVAVLGVAVGVDVSVAVAGRVRLAVVGRGGVIAVVVRGRVAFGVGVVSGVGSLSVVVVGRGLVILVVVRAEAVNVN